MGQIVYGMIAPHPPLLIPDIGGRRIRAIEKTKNALDHASAALTSYSPDAAIFFSPHGRVSHSTVNVYSNKSFEGNFSMFGLPSIQYQANGDSALAEAIVSFAREADFPASLVREHNLDHGVMVPLHFIQDAGYKGSILPVAIALLSLKKLFEFGQILARAVESNEKKVALIASADLSHRLTFDAPAGYSPQGKIFDQKLTKLVSDNDVKGLINFDQDLAEEAGQDALWSIAILLGAIEGKNFKLELLSYEGPFGVGYMVAQCLPAL